MRLHLGALRRRRPSVRPGAERDPGRGPMRGERVVGQGSWQGPAPSCALWARGGTYGRAQPHEEMQADFWGRAGWYPSPPCSGVPCSSRADGARERADVVGLLHVAVLQSCLRRACQLRGQLMLGDRAVMSAGRPRSRRTTAAERQAPRLTQTSESRGAYRRESQVPLVVVVTTRTERAFAGTRPRAFGSRTGHCLSLRTADPDQPGGRGRREGRARCGT